MLVSIIIPNYNYAEYLESCIKSVLNQTYQNFEIIIIDDCSTDNSLQVINKFLVDKRIRLIINGENKGVCHSRNIGFKNSKGCYICLLDPDDYWLPDKIEQQLKIMRTNNANLCFTDIDVLKVNSSIHRRKHFYKEYTYNSLLKRNYIPHSSLMMTKDIIQNVEYIPVSTNSNLIKWIMKICHIKSLIHEDYAFLLELFRTQTVRPSHIAESLVIYRLHNKNFSKSYAKKILSLYCIYRYREQYSTLLSIVYTLRVSFFAYLKNSL